VGRGDEMILRFCMLDVRHEAAWDRTVAFLSGRAGCETPARVKYDMPLEARMYALCQLLPGTWLWSNKATETDPFGEWVTLVGDLE